ncbi:hypothetical protein GCM10028857_20670 [Salinarchaeum chitinilyticum]
MAEVRFTLKSDGFRLDHAAHHTQTPIYGTEADRETGYPDSMNLREHDNRDDVKVWLSQSEVAQFLDRADGTQQRLAFALGARCGLRSHEVLDVAPEHVVDTDAGTVLRVWHGKGDQFRETLVPRDLATTIRIVADVRDAPANSPLLEVTSTRSLRRWVRSTAEELADETGGDGWNHLAFHDL